jgi:hypothetical protein
VTGYLATGHEFGGSAKAFVQLVIWNNPMDKASVVMAKDAINIFFILKFYCACSCLCFRFRLSWILIYLTIYCERMKIKNILDYRDKKNAANAALHKFWEPGSMPGSAYCFLLALYRLSGVPSFLTGPAGACEFLYRLSGVPSFFRTTPVLGALPAAAGFSAGLAAGAFVAAAFGAVAFVVAGFAAGVAVTAGV